MKVDDEARQRSKPAPSDVIRLVVTDMDGTLLTPDKKVTRATLAAVAELKEAGVPVCLVSSRPPGGISMYFETLGLDTPFAALNGATVCDSTGHTLSTLSLSPAAVADAIDMLDVHDVDPWLFCGTDWIVRDETRGYVPHEESVTRIRPTVSPDFSPWLNRVGKITGASADYELLARTETEVSALLAGRASVARSAPYFLDITPLDANKGYALRRLAELLNVAPHEVACLGDMRNDIPMLDVAGLAIAMGNASDEVASHAHVRTSSNEDEGWARAIETYVLPRVARGLGPA